MARSKEHTDNKKDKYYIRIWQIASLVLTLLLIGSLFIENISILKTDTLDEKEIADKTIEYLNKNILQRETTVAIKSIEESNGLYNLKLSIDGRDIDSYVTKNGRLLFPQVIDLTTIPETSNIKIDVPKSKKPKVELFVMSHCPYGTQIEKGIIPVVKILKDKIDFEVKFVNYAMHGKKELDEQLLQYCIQKNHKDKYLTYLGKFLEDGNSEEAIKTSEVIKESINSCISETDKKYKVSESFEDPKKSLWAGSFPPFKVYDVENKNYDVQGSPTLVINGKKIETRRDAQNLLISICNAFDNKPVECEMDLTSVGNPAPGFGYDTQGGSVAAAGCGA
ncbi:hypothetical protein J4440_00080 [Candidatus Woesearchaeota archaeon]|nr:hypothetical protein [Candidatus Woesearchaeota archaeon]